MNRQLLCGVNLSCIVAPQESGILIEAIKNVDSSESVESAVVTTAYAVNYRDEVSLHPLCKMLVPGQIVLAFCVL